ncbi:MAG: response regulator, partial [Bacteroidales bacterium]|nr:response regulator [Bacteroidales bacterium]
MKVVIIEDEKPAVEKLTTMLHTYDPEIEIAAVLSGVDESVKWFTEKGAAIDLIFLDIELNDGNSFGIFEQIEINKPIIFVTAYNEYAIKAFQLNSIDYLLKPLQYERFYQSMEKIKVLRENLPAGRENMQYDEISRLILEFNKNYKSRFLVKVGDHL